MTVKMFHMYLFVIIFLINLFFIVQTEELKKRTQKHKSDVIHPNNNDCKKCSEHLRTFSKIKGSYFNMYPFFYEENKYL